MDPWNVVKVYDDPLNSKGFEGLARLVKCLDDKFGDGLEFWEVRFLDTGFETRRLIKNNGPFARTKPRPRKRGQLSLF